jgi:hypothetical protein
MDIKDLDSIINKLVCDGAPKETIDLVEVFSRNKEALDKDGRLIFSKLSTDDRKIFWNWYTKYGIKDDPKS